MTDLVQLELIRESLIAVVGEMRANIIHASYAPIIYEGHDFSCALMAADGRQVAQGLADHPIHIFAVPYSTREVVKAFGDDIHEGDLFLHNDPYTGGTHLNDVLLLHPVFFEGRLAMFAAIRCHWNDVGGMTPGSLSGRVREIVQEGIRIAPTRICDRGVMNRGVLDLLFNNMRGPAERRGDFNAMLGTGRKAAEHLGRLFARFGGRALLDAVEELIARAERQMRVRIAECPDGDYYAEG
jgi:N-methylhydantoinase B